MADKTINALTSASSVATDDELVLQKAGATSATKATFSAAAAAIMQGSAGFTQSGTGATDRSMLAKAKETVSVLDFGATGDGTTDDTTAFTNALATGQSVYVPKGNYRLTSTITMSTSGQRLIGDGPWLSIIEWDGGSNNAIVLQDDQYMGVRGLMIRLKSGASALTSGYAIAFSRSASNTFQCDVTDCLIYGMYNGILLRSVTEAVVDNTLCWALTGAYGVRFDGASGAASYAATLDGVKFGGMSGNTSIILIDQNSYGYSLRMHKCVMLYGGTGFRMADDTASGSSYPLWCIGTGNECDHNYNAGVSLKAGEGFSWAASWIGSCLNGPGLVTRDNWRGEMTLQGSRVMGNYTNGIALAAGVDAIVQGCMIGDNSAASSGTYHGVYVNPNITKFQIIGNRIGDLVGAAGNNQGYGVYVEVGTSNYYHVTDNILEGNTTGTVSDNGTGLTKIVQVNTTTVDRWYVGDNQYYALISGGNPAINFDSGDFLAYSRASNALSMSIASTVQFWVAASRLILPPGIPTSASGLSSGDIWRDSAASNVLKMVP